MGDIFTANGTTISISTTTAASTVDTATEFAAKTYSAIGLVEDIGEYGDQANDVTFAAIGDGRVRRSKGARDAGVLQVVCAYDPADTGQLQAITAEAANGANANYAFKIVHQDAGNMVHYFRGIVMSKRLRVGTNDNVVRQVFNIAVNSPVVEVA
jgi:hypothetical protein